MKRIGFCLAIVAVLAACPKSSEASDLTEILRIALGTNHHGYQQATQRAHFDHHVDLRAREIEREAVHHVAHHQPLTTGQHVQLHNELDHSAYHDELEHNTAHATRAYAPRPYSTRAYQPQYIQSYRGVPSGYGYGVQYGASQYQPSPYNNRAGCSPYGRY